MICVCRAHMHMHMHTAIVSAIILKAPSSALVHSLILFMHLFTEFQIEYPDAVKPGEFVFFFFSMNIIIRCVDRLVGVLISV